MIIEIIAQIRKVNVPFKIETSSVNIQIQSPPHNPIVQREIIAADIQKILQGSRNNRNSSAHCKNSLVLT